MVVVVGRSLRVAVCVRMGSFVCSCLLFTLIWTVGSLLTDFLFLFYFVAILLFNCFFFFFSLLLSFFLSFLFLSAVRVPRVSVSQKVCWHVTKSSIRRSRCHVYNYIQRTQVSKRP